MENYTLYYQSSEDYKWYDVMSSDNFKLVLLEATVYEDSCGIDDVKIVAKLDNFPYSINLPVRTNW